MLRAMPGPGPARRPTTDAAVVSQDIVRLPVPEQLLVPLLRGRQRVTVAAGDRVMAGEIIVAPVDDHAVGALAPLDVVVSGERTIGTATALVLAPLAGALPGPVLPPPGDDPAALIRRVRAAGVRGYGGGGFPTFLKLREGRERAIRCLVINAVECEPELASDAALLADDAVGVLAGARAAARAAGATRIVLATAHPDTASATMLSGQGVEVLGIEAGYPGGDERMLAPHVTERRLATGERPTAAGVLVLNVATVHAVGLVAAGLVPCRRFVTVLADGATSRCVVDVVMGTPVSEVLRLVGPAPHDSMTSEGGRMMPRRIEDPSWPVSPTTTGIVVSPSIPTAEQPCIRCGLCVPVCPVDLAPDRIWRALESAATEDARPLGVEACTGCRCCDVVCPSGIALGAAFRRAAADLRESDSMAAAAERARVRFERHEARAQARAERARERRPRRSTGGSRGAVEAIVARARKRRSRSDAGRADLVRHDRSGPGDDE